MTMPASPAEFARAGRKMTDKRKYPRAEALHVAEEIVRALYPVCERIEIAGSLRRGKEMVSDCEILFVPRFEDRPIDMFDVAPFNLAEEKIAHLMETGVLSKRPSEIGTFAWGAQNKLALHRSGIPVDLFSTSEENYWVSLVVRTGSLETNLRLTQAARERGRTLLAYGPGVKNLSTGEVTRAESERHVFELCGVPFLAPEDR